jgi:hypothetical protein
MTMKVKVSFFINIAAVAAVLATLAITAATARLHFAKNLAGTSKKKEFNKISKLGYIEHIVEFVYTEDGIV